jgi:hypothetical protein
MGRDKSRWMGQRGPPPRHRGTGYEAWWWTGEVAAGFASTAWLDRAAERAARLARQAGGYADGLRRAADQRLLAWQAAIGLSTRSAARFRV